MMFYLPGTKTDLRAICKRSAPGERSGREMSRERLQSAVSGSMKDRFGNDVYQLLPIEVRLNRDP